MERISRRRLLCGGLAAASLGHPFLRLHAQASSRELFTLGVASGTPQPDGFVLWTRLAPDPLQGGGMGDAPVEVRWEVADDERFSRVVAKGSATATEALAHSVHVEVSGLAPGRPYWYRFTAAGARSPVGRTRTAPADADESTRPVRFAFASCQHYEQGFYAAYRDMAEQPLTSSCTWATTSTKARAARSACASTRAAFRRSWPVFETATRCTRPTRSCRPRTPRFRGW